MHNVAAEQPATTSRLPALAAIERLAELHAPPDILTEAEFSAKKANCRTDSD
jgi:hypothetical protein